MSVKKILKYGDERLRCKTKEVSKISKKIKTLIEDMLDTMYANNGVGLAAPQVGEPLKIFVIDVSLPKELFCPRVFVNPKIISKERPVICSEGCLSFPAVFTDVVRYKDVKVKALDIHGKSFVLEAKDGELLARAIQHEYDHLDGILFVDRVTNRFDADAELGKCDLPPVDPDKMVIDDGINIEELEHLVEKKPEDEKVD